MWMIIDVMRRYIDYITEFDSPQITAFMNKEYFSLIGLSGIYADLSNSKFIIRATIIWAAQFLLVIFYCYTSFYTSIRSLSVNTTYSYFTFTLFLFYATMAFVCVRPITIRRKFARIHSAIQRNFYDYKWEIECPANSWYKIMLKLRRKIVVFSAVATIITAIVVLVLNFQNIEDNPSDGLIFLFYYPMTIESWPLYTMAIVTQFELYCMIYIISMMNVYSFCIISVHWLMQMNRLIDSIKGTEYRAIQYYKKSNPFYIEHQDDFLLYKNKKFIECYTFCITENVRHHQILIR